MKKATSFLLALVMLVSMLPGAAVPAAAAETAAPTRNNYYSNVIVHETFDTIGSGMTTGKVGTTESLNYLEQVVGGARIQTGTPNFEKNGEAAIATIPAINGDFEVTFNADFTKLEVGAAGSKAGFSVDVRVTEAGLRCHYIFSADEAGNIYVTMEHATQRFDTGVDVGATDVDVRIVVDEALNASVLVNGRYVGRFGVPTAKGSAGYYYFIVYCDATNAGANDVVLYDLKLSQGDTTADVMQAYYTNKTPAIDGVLDEKNWPFDAGSKMTLLSDENYLYVALKTTNPAPKFTINGVSVTADVGAGAVTAADGTWAGVCAEVNDRIEVQIPLKSVLGLDYAPGQKVAFSYLWGAASFTGAVVLAGRAMISYQGFEEYVKAGSGEVYFEQPGDGASVLKLKSGTLTSSGAHVEKLSQIDTVDMDLTRGLEFEFTADFADLIVPKTKSSILGYEYEDSSLKANWYDAGLSIELRADPGRRYAFHADASGNIYITQRMNSYRNVTRVDTGLDVGATGAKVRLVSDDAGTTTIYINGSKVGALAAPDWPLVASGGRGYYFLHNSTRQRDTSTSRTNDVTLYNLILTQDVPAPRLVEYPMGGDANKDIKAYLNTSDIKMDGVPGEPAWYLSNNFAATGKAPGGMVGIGWGNGNLYLGGETEADTVTMSIGGKKVSANLKPVPATNAGELAVSSAGFEWSIPLDQFSLPDSVLYREVPYTLTATRNGATSTLTGKLTFSGEEILFGDPGRNYTAKEYTVTSGQGHVTWERTDDGVSITSQKISDPKSVNGTFAQERYARVNYDSGAYNLEINLTINDLPAIRDVFGQRGLVFQLWSKDVQAPMALYNDGNGNVMMAMRYHYGDERKETGLKIGDTATIRLEVDAKRIPSLYVNGEYVHTFSAFDRRNVATHGKPLPNFIINPQNTARTLNADGTLGVVNVVLHEVLLTQTPFVDPQDVVDAALKQMDEAFVIAAGSAQDVTALNLPNRVIVDAVSVPVSVSWSALDKLTGRIPLGVNLNTGAITKGAEAQAFELKAYVSYEGASGTKTFLLHSEGSGTSANKVALIVDDSNPATGSATEWTGSRYAYFDTTHNSIVLDQGSSRAFNRIVLRDSDEYSRVSARHLGVFVSNDNVNYTKVTGWLLHQDGRTYTLYNLNETARYVKVHTYHDDLDITGEQPTFYNLISDMIKVSNEKTLPGAGGKFAYTATFNADNSTGAEKYDTPVFVSLTQLGATAGQYKDGCPDFRFTVGETTLAHWYNGSDGFYVRVPSIPANGSTTVTAHWGCSSALDYSDGETTFEVTYGNVALIDLGKETHEDNGKGSKGQGTGMGTHGRPFTFPNGDVIVVSRQIESDADLAVFRSKDGGHTFDPNPVVAYDDSDYVGRGSGFGGYLWDATGGTQGKGRLYLVGYNGKVGDATDYRIMLLYTDDYGYNWSEPEFLNMPGSELILKKNGGAANYQELDNAEAWMADGIMYKRAITYCDGLKLQGADGDGGNVDYVIIPGLTGYDNPDGKTVTELTEAGGAKGLRDGVSAIYSADGGKTWKCSNDVMTIDVDLSRNAEDGLSEAGFAQFGDGSLFLVVRSQKEGNNYYQECVSTDFGENWTHSTGNILGSNTAPALTKYGEKRLMTWATCTGLGQISYRRTPMHVGISSDEYQTFDKILDVTFATSFDAIQEIESRKTQVGIAVSPSGKDAFISYFDHNYFYHVWDESMYEYVGTVGFLMEDFDQMINKTKGAWDDFEDSSLKFQGWLFGRDGTIMLSREQSVSGKQSMKVLDENMGAPTHALRQIPSMKSGTVGAKLMVPETNQAGFVMELKAAYNFTHMQHTIAAIYVTQSGTVGYVDANKTQHALTTVTPGTWNDYALSYDVNTGKGILFVNGKQVGGEFDLPDLEKDIDLVHGVTAVSFNQAAATEKNGDCLYVDDFYVTEMATMSRTVEANDPVPTLLGRFMTIVRKVIEVNGEKVQIVEWGWVPGL